MKAESNVKHEQIVEAAIRRFSHFGIAKTTLTEVADDLAVSKQALSYYFPDKQSLLDAVGEKLTMDYSRHLQEEIESAPTVEAALQKLTEVKGVFFERYFMLITEGDHLELVRNRSLGHWRKFLAAQELSLLTRVFESGMQTGELKPLDAQKTGELLLETLHAFSRCVKEKGALPDTGAFREVLNRQQEVIRLFYQGLKAEKWVN